MLKHYEGNGIYKVTFISTGRELQISETEIREISDYSSDLEDKYEVVKRELALTEKKVEELYQTIKQIEGRLL